TLGEHSLRQRPDAIHHLARMARIILSHGDDHQIVKDAGKWHVVIDNFGELPLHQWEENTLDRLAHPAIFHWRLGYNRRLVNRILAVSNTGCMKHWKLVFQRVESRMIPEWTFGPAFG